MWRSPAPAVRGAVPVAGHLEGEVAWVRAGVQQLGAGQLLRVGQRGVWGGSPSMRKNFRRAVDFEAIFAPRTPPKNALGQP